MNVDSHQLNLALRLPADTPVEFEPLGESLSAPVRAIVSVPGAEPRHLILRTPADEEAAQNHIAVMDLLTRSGFTAAPALVAVIGNTAVEEEVDGFTALALVPPPGSAEAAIAALAALHTLPTHEGLGWGLSPLDLIPEHEIPLHRLGFPVEEREPALPYLAAIAARLRQTPFGFAHGHATAANILLAQNRAWLTTFDTAGYGSHFFDVAAFLLTSGLEAPARMVLAMQYARLRDFEPATTADLIDEAGIIWGINELLLLPRRQIEALGDDAAMDAIHTASARINRGLRTPAGESPDAAAVRLALWPG